MMRAVAGRLRGALLLLLVLLALAHASGLHVWRAITLLDLALDDARLRAALPAIPPPPHPGVAVVAIDERSVAAAGRWPWSRDRVAALAEALFVGQRAAVVGFDIVFAEPEGAADQRLAQALQGRAAVLGWFLGAGEGRTGVLPPALAIAPPPAGASVVPPRFGAATGNLAVLAAAAAGGGFLNLLPDLDGNVRSLPLLAEQGGQLHAALPLAMVRTAGRGAVALDAARDTAVAAVVVDGPAGLRRVPVDARAAVRVPYGQRLDTVSAIDLLEGRVPAGRLAGRLVIVGVTALGAFDMRSTPLATDTPGVEIQAAVLAGLLDGRFRVVPDWARGVEILQLLLVAALVGFVLPRRGAGAVVAIALALVVALVALNLWLDRAHGLVLPVASALLLALAGAGVVVSWGYVVEGRGRRALTRLFGAYVPPELVDEMARDPDRYSMRAENRELTVMFCDMRNFSSLAETLPPHGLRELVNRVFTAMTQAIRRQRGTLDKYIGDAIMAFWGAPVADADHALRAVRAALDMTARLPALNATDAARGLPPVGLGIGLNTGVVCVGDMGSQLRRSYTVMGDAVNLASRIEGLTRHYGVDILVGEATRAACGDALAWIEVDRVRVKGRAQAVTLFTPVTDAHAADPAFAQDLRLWQLALEAYRGQHWDEVSALLSRMRAHAPEAPFGGLVRSLGERVARWRQAPPPAGWDGTNQFESK